MNSFGGSFLSLASLAIWIYVSFFSGGTAIPNFGPWGPSGWSLIILASVAGK